MGVGEDDIAELLEDEGEPEVCEVLPENWPAVQLYLAEYGQFKLGAHNEVLGFDRIAVDIDIRRSGIEVSQDTWQRFKTLEQLTVNHLATRKQHD